MTDTPHIVRIILLSQAMLFALAATLHSGVIVSGYEHGRAEIAETVIALALIAGAVVTLLRPHLARISGYAAQGFALLGTFVGLFTIAVGIGPQTGLDLSIHALMIASLVGGLVLTWRLPATSA